MKKLLPIFIFYSLLPLTADHHALDREGILKALRIDIEAVEVKSQKVGDGLYVLFGAGGNIAASIGEDGVLIVDDQYILCVVTGGVRARFVRWRRFWACQPLTGV